MTVKRLAFNPKSDGFAFGNRWHLTEREQAVMPDLVIEIFDRAEDSVRQKLELIARTGGAGTAVAGSFARLALGRAGDAAIAGGGTTGNGLVILAGLFAKGLGAVLGTLLGAIGIGTAIDPRTVARETLRLFVKKGTAAGFCGGMAATALDYHAHAMVLPRGTGEQPQEGGSEEEAWLRRYIFDRLCDTLREYGPRFLETQVLYHLEDDEAAGAAMLALTTASVDRIIADIDAGKPCGVGLVTSSLDPSRSHQVICYGYERRSPHHVELLIHDNKRPDQEEVLVILTGEDSVTIYQPDEFMSYDEGSGKIEPKPDKSDPGWCSILYLDYTPRKPRPAVIAEAPLAAEPEAIIAHDPVTLSTTLRATGHGGPPPGTVRLSRWNVPVEDRPGTEVKWSGDRSAPVSVTDKPPRPLGVRDSIKYDLVFNANVDWSKVSVVHALRGYGLDYWIPQFFRPHISGGMIPALTAELPTPQLREGDPPPSAACRKAAASGASVNRFVRIGTPRLDLESPDIGDRCYPEAYPGKRIRVRPGEDSLLPAEQPVERKWTISVDGEIHTRTTATNELAFSLPKDVGAIVVVTAIFRYAAGPPLTESLTVVVNDEAGRDQAALFRKLKRQLDQLEADLRQPPKGKDPGWVMERDIFLQLGRPGIDMRRTADLAAAQLRNRAKLEREIARRRPG